VFVEHVRRDRLDAFDFHLVFLRFELVFTPVTLLSTTVHSRLLLGVFWVQKAFGQRELFRLADVFAHRLRALSFSFCVRNVAAAELEKTNEVSSLVFFCTPPLGAHATFTKSLPKAGKREKGDESFFRRGGGPNAAGSNHRRPQRRRLSEDVREFPTAVRRSSSSRRR
jgi:hypothetical protein